MARIDADARLTSAENEALPSPSSSVFIRAIRGQDSPATKRRVWIRPAPRPLAYIPVLVLAASLAFAQQPDGDTRGLQGLPEIAFDHLTDRNVTVLGRAALEIRPGEWKHGETENFVYHFFHGFVATPVSVEAEYYYRVFAKQLGKDTSQWERKSHIYIFESPEDWAAFQKKAALDPWTGGIHSNGDLFIQRNPQYKFKGRTLGHEISHLVLYRFFGAGVPLWLNEGYAEYASIGAYASYERARGMAARPQSSRIAPADYLPVGELAAISVYPEEIAQVRTFYEESEKLVRFLNAESAPGFLLFLDGLSQGNKFETALQKGYSGRFPAMTDLDRDFQKYATQDFAAPAAP